MVKPEIERITYVGDIKEEKKENKFLEYVKFGAGFYVGFNLARLVKRLIKGIM